MISLDSAYLVPAHVCVFYRQSCTRAIIFPLGVGVITSIDLFPYSVYSYVMPQNNAITKDSGLFNHSAVFVSLLVSVFFFIFLDLPVSNYLAI
jgi:hypothetical protein